MHILGINIVTCERLSIATQTREPAEDVEVSLSMYHDECTEPRTKLIPLLQASVWARRCGLAGTAVRRGGSNTRSALFERLPRSAGTHPGKHPVRQRLIPFSSDNLLVAAHAREVPMDMNVEERFPGVDHERVLSRLRRAVDSISIGRVIMIKFIKLSACTSAA